MEDDAPLACGEGKNIMPVYTILSVDVQPPCAAGQRHLARASLFVDGGAAGIAPIAQLLTMIDASDRFVVGPIARPEAQVAATFPLCACGNGHLLAPAGSVDEYPARG